MELPELPEGTEHAELIGNKIIVTKGLSCTGKSIISKVISCWARCPLVSMDDLLDALSVEKGYSEECIPSDEEGARLRRLATIALIKVAHRNLSFPPFGVVIKTRLSSLYELDMLLRVAVSLESASLVIIVECKMKNEHRFRNRLEHKVETFGREEWYKARSWKDIENARDEIDDQAWDDHARRLTDSRRDYMGNSPRVIKLVIDPFDDLNIDPYQDWTMSSTFLGAISYLQLTQGDAPGSIEANELILRRKDAYCSGDDENLSDEELNPESVKGSSYLIVQYDKVQRLLFKSELKASKFRERSKYLCPAKGRDCVFKILLLEDNRYHYLPEFDDDNKDKIYCGACEERVDPGQHAYTCYYCVLTLHKSCAKTLDFEFVQRIPYHSFVRPMFVYSEQLKHKHTCNSCVDSNKGFSKDCYGCIFQTHLKCKMLPTIINHDIHKHLLSIRVTNKSVICKTCGSLHEATGYVCHICKFYYEMECIFLPAQVMHEHGGYKHLMKLMYTHQGMEQEEPYWCDSCYCDMDPQNWFYYCQECPYYVTHTYCVGSDRIIKARKFNNLPLQF